MSFIPEFELGLWNAWILIVPLIIYWVGGVKFLFSKRMPESSPPSEKKDKILTNLLVISMFASFIYSVFLPLKIGTIWFFIGLVFYFIGLFLITITLINFYTSPMNEPVTKGVYRFSRNPMFIGFFLVYVGISIACFSWVYLLITALFIVIVNYVSPLEEEITIKHYGKSYKDYMEITPKWIGLPKSGKK
jgi:protein-S-isoprenylcysteine O-methyltransferase Ste14